MKTHLKSRHIPGRFLSPDEESRFRAALNSREEKIRGASNSSLPHLRHSDPDFFVDAIKPMILLSLNTGLLPGELFRLAWEHIDFSLALLTVKSDKRNNKTRRIPLSREALKTLQHWRYQQGTGIGEEELVFFPHEDQGKYIYLERCWQEIVSEAAITQFCWHNMRSHIANRLEREGVDWNRIEEWLGISGANRGSFGFG